MTSPGGRQADALELDTLLGNTADGVCAVNGGGRVVLWNRAAEKMLGYTAREVLGRPCCEVFVGLDGAGNRLCYQGCHVMALVTRGEPIQHFDMATRTKAGKPVWLDISILVVQGARRELATTVHLFRDVTAVHEIEALVRERLAQAAPPSADSAAATQLTRRELEILRLMTGGANTRAMAERLHVSPATVRNHVQNILGKLGVHSRLEAAAYAMRHGLLGPEGSPGGSRGR
ncbi:MAG TPA: LuxR C-terminal-related transcriptional regulator [Methylomirabilota bacterium]|jgi:PAS domain S-box-containing protein|nr:LuxR C-terminal-related transcriptional regulator [Methylomirabilota bacterium]